MISILLIYVHDVPVHESLDHSSTYRCGYYTFIHLTIMHHFRYTRANDDKE